jgi:porphobilinogen synthase
MRFPIYRPRRLRRNENFRRLVRETKLSVDDLIMPLFIVPGTRVTNPISSMPGIAQLSVDRAVEECKAIRDLGISGVILFGIPDHKDALGSDAYKEDGIIQRALGTLKEQVPGLSLITDVCFCEYTDHGQCGIIKGQDVDNDATLEILVKESLSHARAGADMVAPSDMMDGRIGAIRQALDSEGFPHVPIMAYSAKFASGFYGDRRSYQMDPPNAEEALREVEMDIAEGADIVMVKPALPYLDIIHRVKEKFGYPLAAYNVSGEYAMIKAAALNGWLDEERVMMEALTGIKRAGADIILTYFAKEAAKILK